MTKLQNAALRLLSRRDHSIKELKTKLRQRVEFNEDEFNDTISYLARLGYLPNEENLAKRLVTEWTKQGRSLRWIKGKLRSRGLNFEPKSTDEEEVQSALVFIKKKLTRPQELSFKDRSKLARALQNRGFAPSIIRAALSKSPIAKN